MAPTASIVAEVLREDNYEEWIDIVRNYLMAQGLWWGIVDDSRVVADFEELEKRNAAALHAIKTSCSPHILSDLKKNTDLQTANKLWLALKDKLGKPHPPPNSDGNANANNPEELRQFVPLFRAINKGDLYGVKNFLRHNPDARKAKISDTGMTAIHLATLAGHVEIVEELIREMTEDDLVKRNNAGETALCIAAYNGMTEIAQILVREHFDLIGIPSKNKLIPVSIACIRGHKQATHYLYSVTAQHLKEFRENNIILLNDAIFNNMFDIALDLVKNEPPGLGTKSCRWYCRSALVTLSSMPAAFLSSTRFSFWQRLIYRCIPVKPPDCTRVCIYDPQMYKEPRQPLAGLLRFLEFIGIKQIYERKLIHAQALQLLRHICRELSPLDAKQYEEITTSLFRSVKNGITEIVVEIIQAHPDMLWKRTNDYRRDIFQYAIEKRQENVFSLIYGLDARRVPLITSADSHGNNMLHIAGYLAAPTQLAHISGAALQLQRELQWFQEIERIMNAKCKEEENKDGETPKQVFTKSHKDLVIEGEKWMKEYATACTVVGALIIIIMFAAAVTVPGGSDGDTGLPFFLHKTSFMVYIISDAVGLFSSSASVLMFLGMLTSRYSEEDFLKSLPRKLMFGVFTLFCSITAMMVTFCAALIIMLKGQLAVIVPIVVLASFTVVVTFVILQFPLLLDIFHCTYGNIFTRKVDRSCGSE